MIRRVVLLVTLSLALSLAPAHADDTPIRTAVFRVEGMTCGLCARSIEKALRGVDGVYSVSIEPSGGRVTVVADATLPDARLESAIEAAGRYQAEPIGAPD